MAGYHNYSMSNNAVAAYENGEMPQSKWTKTNILDTIYLDCGIEETKYELLKKMTVKELKRHFLFLSGWHHTSKYYNLTAFYAIDSEAVEEITQEKIKEIISSRVRIKKTAEEKETEKIKKAEEKSLKEERAAKKAEEKAILKEKESLFKYQKQYKTMSGFLRSKTVNFDVLREVRKKRIAEKREELRQIWERQGCQSRLSNIDDDRFIDFYIR